MNPFFSRGGVIRHCKDVEFFEMKSLPRQYLTLPSENHHVIRVDDNSCDLEGFASAGFATWTDEHFDLYDAERAFSDPGPRSGKGPGSLNDTVRFGRARYEWQGKDFIVYTTMFTENWMRGAQQFLFLLAPCGDKVVDGHHADIDALLLACGSWTKELHEEIFVFDQARWSKSKSLYKSVESSSWDDVILHPDTKSKLIEDIQGFFGNQELYKSFGIPWKRGVSKSLLCISRAESWMPVYEAVTCVRILTAPLSPPWCSW